MNLNSNNEFKDVLKLYMDKLNCSGLELSKYSNISPSVISRYKSGEKIPKTGSEQLTNLINGIVKIAQDKKINDIDKDSVILSFSPFMDDINLELLINNFNLLIDTLSISVADMARALGYDPSYLSKIRTGSRKPAYKLEFANAVVKYILRTYKDDNDRNKIKELINIDNLNNDNFLNELLKWLCSNVNVKSEENRINHFLNELNNFNLDDYIKVIHFDELKVYSLPLNFPKNKNYYGLEEMKQAELDFLKNVVLDKSKKDVFMCSDMQMDDMTKDIKFGKSWMFGIAMMLKKDLHLNIIHNLDRPFNEMMLGLESWIPIYMTGQVSPYYYKNYNDKIYSHLHYVSGNYALYGECVLGSHNKGKYYLTNNKKEIEYYQEKAKLLLNKATPLMDIYTDQNINEIYSFYESDIKSDGNRKRILSSLPFHTISIDLLKKVCEYNNISEDNEKILLEFLNKEKEYIDKLVENNKLTDEIYVLDEKEFNNNILISTNKHFKNFELKYTYELYLEHFKETKKYSKINKNYELIIGNKQVFNNIDIYINEKKYVVLSKRNNPRIHFVIKHEKLVNAISDFVPLVIDGDK